MSEDNWDKAWNKNMTSEKREKIAQKININNNKQDETIEKVELKEVKPEVHETVQKHKTFFERVTSLFKKK